MAKNKNNQAKASNKKSNSLRGIDVIDNMGAVSSTDAAGSMPYNTNKSGAANVDGITDYAAKTKNKK